MSDPKHETSEKRKSPTDPGNPGDPAEKTRPLAQKIGLEKLDLSIEEVEERISPRETNVFDK